jgi:NADH dehydrogenase
MAGAIAEIGRKTLEREFPNIKPSELRVKLIEGADRLLTSYDPDLSDHARRDLQEMGVEVFLNRFVKEVTAEKVVAGDLEIETVNVVWAAGNQAVPLLKTLDTEMNRAGQVVVGPDLTIAEDEWIFVVGDAAFAKNDKNQALPGVAQVALQGGQYVGRIIKGKVRRGWRQPFRYFDKGNMATIGRNRAIVQSGKFKATGFVAWVMWSVVHVFYLVGFRNQLRVMIEWLWMYWTFKPGSRIIYWREEARKRAELTDPVPALPEQVL